MPRYIDSDWIYQMVENRYRVSSGIEHRCERDLLDLICQAPTADVVPKSEVERLVDKWIGEENLTQDEKTLRLIEAVRDEAKRYERYYFNHEYDKLIAEAKAEGAREIFEEIERLLREHSDYEILCDGKSLWYYEESLGEDIAELKKKYTEGE